MACRIAGNRMWLLEPYYRVGEQEIAALAMILAAAGLRLLLQLARAFRNCNVDIQRSARRLRLEKRYALRSAGMKSWQSRFSFRSDGVRLAGSPRMGKGAGGVEQIKIRQPTLELAQVRLPV